MNQNKCPISGYKAEIASKHGGSREFYVKCDLTGDYQITRTASRMVEALEDEQKLKLIWALRDNHENGIATFIKSDNIDQLSSSINPAFDPIDRVNRILLFIFKKLRRPSDELEFDFQADYPIAQAEDFEEFMHYITLASDLGYIEYTSTSSLRPTIQGWQYYKHLKSIQLSSNQAFVAMWFKSELDDVWEKGFQRALKRAEYDPLRIDISEHNDKICDRINIEIRKSSILVADFTGSRGGVYFEAGLALGLGIPVIWTCRNDYIDNLHFDTRQYNHIVWASPRELCEKLLNRIKATIPGKLNVGDS